MSLQDQLFNRRDGILRAAQSNGVKNVRIFGSVARQQDDKESDVDFLVELGCFNSSIFRTGIKNCFECCRKGTSGNQTKIRKD